MNKKIILIFFVFCLLFLFLTFSGARAISSISFSSTVNWDSGTKSAIDTVTNSGTLCNSKGSDAIYLNLSNGYLGIGDILGDSLCPTGTRIAPSTSLSVSYDMQTLLTGSMKDFSINNRVGILANINIATGKFGSAYDWNGTQSYITIPAFALSGSTFTIDMWIKPYIYVPIRQTLFSDGSDGNSNGYIWLWKAAGGTDFTMEYYSTGNAYADVTCANFFSGYNNTWMNVGVVVDYSSKYIGFFRDGVKICGKALSSTAIFPAESRKRFIGNYYDIAPYNAHFFGKIDEFLFFNGNLTESMIGFGSDSRSNYASSGIWLSPVESGDSYPSMISINYGNTTLTRTISLIQLQTPTGIVIWSRNIALTSGSSFAVIPNFSIQTVTGNWTISLTLTGNNTGTPFISSLVINLVSSATSILDMNLIILILLFIAFVILLIFGLIERFAMVGASLVSVFIAIETWVITTNPVVPAIFIFITAICATYAITKKV
jgi:hypothetical protein